ncbi:MAG: hypothetical protein ACRDT2_01175 [Natronosporangium sp.]
MATPPADEPDGSDVSETGVGWPGERPRPAVPPGEAAVLPEEAVDPHREAAVRRLREQAERDRAAAGSTGGAGVPPLGSQPVGAVRPSVRPGTWRRVPEPIVAERPGNVTAAAVILFVGAGLGALGCCGVNYLAGQADLSSAEQNLVMLLGAILLGSALLNVLLGYYILQGRQWARVTTIVFCSIAIVASVVNQFASFGDAEATGPFSTCLGVILNVLVIGLLSGERAGYYFRFANS